MLSPGTETRGEFLSPPEEGANNLRQGTADRYCGLEEGGVGSEMCLHLYPFTHWFLNFFIQPARIGCLLCARHCTQSWRCKNHMKPSSLFKGSPHRVREADN